MIIEPRRMAIAVMVRLAFFASGALNAGTPLLIASTPVSEVHPAANALRIKKSETESVVAL